jgi:hypothetical protein
MMMCFSAETIDSFTILAAQHINNLVIHQTLQSSIHSSQANALTFALHQAIHLLRASETTSAF